MKCRAAVLLICVLTAAGAAAQSGTNGQFTVTDPNQIFGTGIATTFNANNATFTIDFQSVNSQGKLTFFHFHTDSTDPNISGNWLLTFGNSAGMQGGSYTVDQAGAINASLSGNGGSCVAQAGSTFSFGALNNDVSGEVNSLSGSYNFTCGTGQTVSGTFNFTAPVGTGGGGGGTGGSGGGGGSVTTGIGKIPGLGTLPTGPGVTVTPTAPPAPTLFVVAPTTVIDLNSGETTTVKVTTTGNETLGSDVALSATGPAGMTLTFNPPTIAAPGTGSSTLTIGTSAGVQVGDQRVEILARGTGVSARTAVRLRVFCDPALILGIDQPRSTSIASGKTATLTVNASGSGPFTYQWYEGHRGSLVFPVAGATSATFTTPALTSGTEYWVRVSNPCGSVDSQNAVVNVTP